MTEQELHDHPGWRWCTAEGAREQVLLLGLQTTFREKLEWLEEAETVILQMRASRETRPGAPSGPITPKASAPLVPI